MPTHLKALVMKSCRMRSLVLKLVALAALGFATAEEFKIEVTYSVSCDRKTKSGDTIAVNYNGTLTNGEEFDSSMYTPSKIQG